MAMAVATAENQLKPKAMDDQGSQLTMRPSNK
jgi:hypothetical protein